jgi:hypothetical protein
MVLKESATVRVVHRAGRAIHRLLNRAGSLNRAKALFPFSAHDQRKPHLESPTARMILEPVHRSM